MRDLESDEEPYVNEFKAILEKSPGIDEEKFLIWAYETICFIEDRDDMEKREIERNRKKYMALAREVWKEH